MIMYESLLFTRQKVREMKKIWNCKELSKEREEEKETSNRREKVKKKMHFKPLDQN